MKIKTIATSKARMILFRRCVRICIRQQCDSMRSLELQSVITGLFSLRPSRTNAPNPFGIQGEKFSCTRSLLGESVLHRFGINKPVLSCLFLFLLKSTPVLRLASLPPPHSDVSCFHPKASYRSFLPPGSLLPITYPCLGRLGVRAPSENLLQL